MSSILNSFNFYTVILATCGLPSSQKQDRTFSVDQCSTMGLQCLMYSPICDCRTLLLLFHHVAGNSTEYGPRRRMTDKTTTWLILRLSSFERKPQLLRVLELTRLQMQC
ncbi:unnamed protein product [Tenebrio molitor]|nr:unnamed protein product [Tenebrio molitor]